MAGLRIVDSQFDSDPKRNGAFVQTPVVTDIASAGRSLRRCLVRERTLSIVVLGEAGRRLPFPLVVVDGDNDTAFMK